MKNGPHYLFILVPFIIGVLIAILDLSGALNSVPWISAHIPTLTLLVVSMVLSYLVFERGNKLDTIESLIRNALDGADVQVFENRKEFFEYAVRKIQKAERIDVTHFGLSAPSIDDTYSVDYYKAFAKVIKSKRLRVRRILIVRNQRHVDWARQMLEEFSDCPNFFLSSLPNSSNYVPMMNLMIVDNMEVYLGGEERSPSYEPRTIVVRHPKFAESIQEHFMTLWRDSVKLKTIDDLDQLMARMGGFSNPLQSGEPHEIAGSPPGQP